MNSKIKNIFVFLTGVAVGSAATWKIVKTKYQRIANEEIESVKAQFSEKKITPVKDIEKEHVSEKTEYESMVEELEYDRSEVREEIVKKDTSNGPSHVYVIPPESVGECDYEITSLTYYADNVLTDETDKIVENIDDMIGEESLNHFGEFEDDSVYVRNDKLETDFEILRDLRRYSDVFTINSHPNKED